MAKIFYFSLIFLGMNVTALLAGEAEPSKATLKGMVTVHMKKSSGYATYYGDRTIAGIKSPESNDRLLVLEIPGAGKISIPQNAVEKIVPIDSPAQGGQAVPAALGARTIQTTHAVHLKNGKVLRGIVVPGPGSEPLKLEIPGLGRTEIPRSRIEKIAEEKGEILIPEPEPEPAAAAEKPKETSQAPPEATAPEGEKEPVPAIDPGLRAEILGQIYNLTRWRSRDRVRAENQLRAIGAPAIPFLETVIRDPFDLTRRAAMRIIRDVADPAGIPLAIEGLLDDDGDVREAAGEALRKMTGLNLGFRPYGSLERRQQAYRLWKEWLAEK